MSAPTSTYGPGSVPTGQSAPFVIASATNHSADIVIVAATGVALILVAFVIRVYIRCSFSGPWLADDTVFALATVASLAQSSLVCASVHFGWGKVIQDINPFDLVKAEKLVYASDILYIITLALSKHSLDLLFIRLTPYNSHIRVAKCIRYFTLVWAVTSLGVISLRCHTRTPWIDIINGQCPSMLVRWQIVTAFNIISEAAIFGMSIFLIFGLKMALSQKTIVVSAFGMRLPTIIFCALRIHYFFQAFFTTDPSFDGVFFAAWTQTELAFSVISATLPCLKPFMSTISTNWGEAPKPEFASSNQSGSYGLKDLFGKSNTTGTNASKSEVAASERESQYNLATDLPYEPVHGNAINHRTLRGDSVSHTTTVMHGFTLGDAVSTRSNDSQQMIIRKDTMYSVDHA
ncbi:hypothetical protein N431DRAFT_377866, partial [Stipitochalara longipes BDJ]